jgi:UDP-N-acetylmuramyl pentapeptide phosphotransferase/UDP-N-acetylglucosamine-1-phosphate transferase
MGQIIFGGIMAFLVTLLVIPVIIVIAKKKKLYDEPDDKRKLHKQPIPSFGGLAIFIGFILSLLLSVNFSVDAPEFQYYIVGFLLIFFLGIKDDIMIISPAKKFMGQVLAAVILVYKAKLSITNMDGFIGFTKLTLSLVSCFLF